MLRTAGVPLDALPWRKPSLAAADAGHRRLSARPPDQLRAGDGRTRSIGAVRSQLSRPRLDQGLSGPDEPRHVRRTASAPLRTHRFAILRFRRAPGRTRPHEPDAPPDALGRSEEHTSELQSLMRISYAVFCLKKKNQTARIQITYTKHTQR